jgi:hypothetical protein
MVRGATQQGSEGCGAVEAWTRGREPAAVVPGLLAPAVRALLGAGGMRVERRGLPRRDGVDDPLGGHDDRFGLCHGQAVDVVEGEVTQRDGQHEGVLVLHGPHALEHVYDSRGGV